MASHRATARLLLVGDGLSAFGTWIDFLAILTVSTWQYHVTPYQMALVSGAGLLPGILVAARIGRWCDRGDAKRLLLVSIALRVAATAGILLCHDFTLFVALVAARSICATVAGPAINVMAVRALDAAALPRFYAALNVLNSSAKIAAPAIGTVSASLGGDASALSMSIAFSAAALLVFTAVRSAPAPAAGASADTPASAAVAAPAASASLVPLLWIAATYAFSVFMVNNLVPLVLQRAGFDKALLGVLVSCSGAGNILCGLWLARRAPAVGAATAAGAMTPAVVSALVQAAGFALIGVVLWGSWRSATLLLPAMFFAIGMVSARFAIALNVYMTARHAGAIGAVSGTLQAWQSSMILIAPTLGAAVLEALGGPALFWCSALSAALSFGVLALVARRHAGINARQVPPAAAADSAR